MSTVNKAMIIGRVGTKEFKQSTSGKTLCTLSVATDESYKNSEGEKIEKTEWHQVAIWGNYAEIINEFVDKGDHIYVEGKNRTRSWEDEQGNKRYSHSIEAKEIFKLNKKEG